jgi:hypothetical protein
MTHSHARKLVPYLNGPVSTKTANRRNIKMMFEIARGNFKGKFPKSKEEKWKFLWKNVLACEHERRMSDAILPDNGISVKERHISLEPF